MMDWSEPTIRRVYEGNLVGEEWPYVGGSEADVETFLRDVVIDLGQSDLLTVEADFNHFGSGYASFVEVFCVKKDGSGTRPYMGTGKVVDGLLVYLCRRAPIAAYGADTRAYHAGGGSSGFLGPDTVGITPAGDWEAAVREVCAKLSERGISIADVEMLRHPLTFEYTIDNNLSDAPYQALDVLFYWYD
jgi:hypothetical protein